MMKNAIKQYLRTQKFKKGKRSYSQSGEDLIISYAFGLKGILKPNYIDIGAFHPFDLSNTALFYQNGSTGINIEPNFYNYQLFEKFRRKDVNLNVGVGPEEENIKYFSFNNPSLNTFSMLEAEKMTHLYETTKNKRYKLIDTYKVKVLPLNNILKNYMSAGNLDLLSIDVEGMDFELLKTLDFNKYPPKIICVESVEYSIDGKGEKRKDVIDYLEEKGYFEYAFTNINSIMINQSFWNS
mgnify:CR=1 FL=1